MDFTPIIPCNIKGNIDASLIDAADDIRLKSAALTGSHAPQIIEAVKNLLRITNSYYSNRIESEGTHPVDIERAMKKNFSSNSRQKDMQKLSLAHIETQKWIEGVFSHPTSLSPYSREFISNVHKTLYSQEGMEPFLRYKLNDAEYTMTPGEFRNTNVEIGDHEAPDHEELDSLLVKFEDLYGRSLKETGALKLIHVLASHHRLLWIHPFIDGNGRTARLVLDGAFSAISMQGYGLWNISRGLARKSSVYKELLAHADMTRQGNYDGKGALSSDALKEFVLFMMECADDQISYMGKYLNLGSLSVRIDAYASKAKEGLFDINPLPKNSERVFKELLLRGEIARGEVDGIINASRRTAAKMTRELLKREYLESDSPKGVIRLKIESHLAKQLFPELIPD